MGGPGPAEGIVAVVAVLQYVRSVAVRDEERRWLPSPGQAPVHGVDLVAPLLLGHGDADIVVSGAGQGFKVVQREEDGPEDIFEMSAAEYRRRYLA